MPNIGQVLKQEILRLARREVRGSQKALKNECAALKAQVRELRARVAALDKASGARRSGGSCGVASGPASNEPQVGMRFNSKSLRSLRQRLGVSQKEMGRLVGVTAQAVYLWECKGGSLRLRNDTRQALLKLKAAGRRGVAKQLACAKAA